MRWGARRAAWRPSWPAWLGRDRRAVEVALVELGHARELVLAERRLLRCRCELLQLLGAVDVRQRGGDGGVGQQPQQRRLAQRAPGALGQEAQALDLLDALQQPLAP